MDYFTYSIQWPNFGLFSEISSGLKFNFFLTKFCFLFLFSWFIEGSNTFVWKILFIGVMKWAYYLISLVLVVNRPRESLTHFAGFTHPSPTHHSRVPRPNHTSKLKFFFATFEKLLKRKVLIDPEFSWIIKIFSAFW